MNILAATDFTDLATHASAYAAGIAKLRKSKLILFNLFTPSIHALNSQFSAENFQRMYDRTRDRLQEKADALSKEFDIEVIAELSFISMDEALDTIIGKHEVSLLVFGMNEKTWDIELLGDTTTAVIKNCRVPTLAVPFKASFDHLKKILFATDLVEELPQPIIERIRIVAETIGGEVEVFNVDKKVAELKAENSDALAINAIDSGLQGINYYYKNVKSNAVIREIEKEIKQTKADLLIMVPKKYGFGASIVHRSKTGIMASGLNIPLLSIPVGYVPVDVLG